MNAGAGTRIVNPSLREVVANEAELDRFLETPPEAGCAAAWALDGEPHADNHGRRVDWDPATQAVASPPEPNGGHLALVGSAPIW